MDTSPQPPHTHAALDPIPQQDHINWFGFDDADDGPDLKRGVGFFAFNTAVDICGYGPKEACAAAFEEAIGLCRTWERLFSRTLPHSDVARLNHGGGQWVAIAPETAQVLRIALDYCRLSPGTFDITIGSASRLWDFHEGKIPASSELAQAVEAVDWRQVELDIPQDGAVRARLRNPEAMVDLGGIAKGWMADKLTERLASAGLGGAVVNLGGNVAVIGSKPDGQPWTVGIRDPFDNQTLIGTLKLREGAVVTSGVGERSFMADSIRLHHILDPRTGWPVQTDVASVTVVARTAIAAEGFSTTLLALGMETGRAFAVAQPEIIQAYFIDGDRNIFPARQGPAGA